MKFIAYFLAIAFGAVFGVAIVAILDMNLTVINLPATDATVSYADLAAINLTAATVALAAVAVTVTVAAVFGFKVIRDASVSGAESRVKRDLPKLLEKELRQMEKDGSLSAALARTIYSGEDPGAEGGDPE